VVQGSGHNPDQITVQKECRAGSEEPPTNSLPIRECRRERSLRRSGGEGWNEILGLEKAVIIGCCSSSACVARWRFLLLTNPGLIKLLDDDNPGAEAANDNSSGTVAFPSQANSRWRPCSWRATLCRPARSQQW
jgi:hypothetical protein